MPEETFIAACTSDIELKGMSADTISHRITAKLRRRRQPQIAVTTSERSERSAATRARSCL
eukprot:547315-Prorocentrum_minimum.AAC.1